MAFVATVETAAGELEIGVARYHTNPDGLSCEFAIVVADEWLGKGIGRSLMRELMQRAAARGLQTMRGTVMLDNHAMVAFVKSLGFSVARSSTLDEFVASRELSDFLPS